MGKITQFILFFTSMLSFNLILRVEASLAKISACQGFGCQEQEVKGNGGKEFGYF